MRGEHDACLCVPLLATDPRWPLASVWCANCACACMMCMLCMYDIPGGQYDVQCCCHQVAWLPLWPASRWPVWEYADQYNARQLPVTWEDAVGKWNERRFILETILSPHQKVHFNFLVFFLFHVLCIIAIQCFSIHILFTVYKCLIWTLVNKQTHVIS